MIGHPLIDAITDQFDAALVDCNYCADPQRRQSCPAGPACPYTCGDGLQLLLQQHIVVQGSRFTIEFYGGAAIHQQQAERNGK